MWWLTQQNYGVKLIFYSYNQTLYLFKSKKFVLYFSIYLNSSVLSIWEETYLMTAILKMSKEKVIWWTSLACTDSADLSNFLLLKLLLWPLVLFLHSCVVLPRLLSIYIECTPTCILTITGAHLEGEGEGVLPCPNSRATFCALILLPNGLVSMGGPIVLQFLIAWPLNV